LKNRKGRQEQGHCQHPRQSVVKKDAHSNARQLLRTEGTRSVIRVVREPKAREDRVVEGGGAGSSFKKIALAIRQEVVREERKKSKWCLVVLGEVGGGNQAACPPFDLVIAQEEPQIPRTSKNRRGKQDTKASVCQLKQESRSTGRKRENEKAYYL